VLRGFACGWFGIQTLSAGGGEDFVIALWPDFANLGGGFDLLGLSCRDDPFCSSGASDLHHLRDDGSRFENWPPDRAGDGGVLLGWACRARGGRALLDAVKFDSFGDFWGCFCVAHAMVSFWGRCPERADSRLRGGRAADDGQALGAATMICSRRWAC